MEAGDGCLLNSTFACNTYSPPNLTGVGVVGGKGYSSAKLANPALGASFLETNRPVNAH